MHPAHSDGLVIGLDSSTQSCKAIAWDPSGRCVAEGRASIPLANPGFDRYEQDPVDWWRAAVAALRGCMAGIEGGRIEGLAISNQRETVAFLDNRGEAVHPAITWLDGRARKQLDSVSRALGAETIHRITGRPPNLTTCLFVLAWMRENEPEVFARTACFADVQTFLVQRLAGGAFRTGWISADPLSLYDVVDKRWSPTILAAVGIEAERLPVALPPGSELGRVGAEAADLTGLPVGLPIFAAGGDGQCAGLGTNCTRPDRAYVNLGTAVVSGVWSPEYRYNRAWRTELAAQGEGYIFENCLRGGAFLVNWFVDQFVPGGRAGSDVFARLEEAALHVPIGSEGLMVQPYWGGVMDPYWDVDARGVILGLTGSHTPVHVYRAIIEGITLDQVMRTGSMEAASGQVVDHYVAIGGGASSPLWRQMLADASGKCVLVSDTVEASALGAGMIAAYGAGWYPTIVDAAQSMTGKTTAIEPDPAAQERYAELLEIYRSVYDANSGINRRLVAFARGSVS
jgi:xylulokinase